MLTKMMRFGRGVLALAAAAIPMPLLAASTPANPTGIDFSYAGYKGGGQPIPYVRSVIALRPTGADDTALLQNAIDHVAAMPMDPQGFRGAILLRPGTFHVKGQLTIRASGIVLRGSGDGSGGTVIVAEGTGRRTLIQIGGDAPRLGKEIAATDDSVPAGERTLHLASVEGMHVGSAIVIRRPSTADWIHAHGMSGLLGTFADQRVDWKPGSHDLIWDRTVTSVDAVAHTVAVDAPITFLLEKSNGGAMVAPVEGDSVPRDVGVENLALDSAYDHTNPKDEEHSWIAIGLDHVQDAWVGHVTSRHFVASLAHVNAGARRITIEDSQALAPVSEVGGYRRQSFVVYGQQVLVYRCHSEKGMNDFATGLLAAGPNVFLDDDATGSLEPSGSFEGFAAGVLYERVHVPDSRIELLLDQTRAQGAGWTAVNSLIWNSTAQSLDAMGPFDGYNYTIQSPQSLYESELIARGLHLSKPAAQTTSHAAATALHVPEFSDAKAAPQQELAQHPFSIVHGYFSVDGKLAYGGGASDTWWHGSTSSFPGQVGGSSVTRFMPGQTAQGLTEDLHELVARVKKRGDVTYQTIPGLWYEHRRDEHTVFRQPNGDVWAPFFEMPWARSGKGFAWDGLSRFDVSKYNPWYFERNREFVQLAGEQGLIVIHNLYNTHDVLEIGPHWIDYPWRPANNVNDTGLPEPPPFKGGYTVAMDTVQPKVTKLNVGNQFYSVDYPPLRKLHHDYIFHVLDELGDQPNVIFTIAYQYAGPLAFAQFFQDTIAEWERLHHRKVRVALITSKGITDAILNDPGRSKQVAVVDMRYWYYLADGKLFAPEAGQNRAYRDIITSTFGENYTNSGPPTTEEQLYRQVREYRDRYPNLVLLPLENGGGPLAILMGGGMSQATGGIRGAIGGRAGMPSDAAVNAFVREHLADDLMKISPADGLTTDAQQNWVLAGSGTDAVLIYSRAGREVVLAKALPQAAYNGLWFDPVSGQSHEVQGIAGAAGTKIPKPDEKRWLLLLRPQQGN